MIVLWSLMLRGISIEFRSYVESPARRPLWDVVFGGASGLQAIFFGAALGNGVRGMPLDASGFSFCPLWTNFGVSGALGILDWYTVIIGLAAFATVTLHGALWVALKTEAARGPVPQTCGAYGVGGRGSGCADHGGELSDSAAALRQLFGKAVGYVFPVWRWPHWRWFACGSHAARRLRLSLLQHLSQICWSARPSACTPTFCHRGGIPSLG
jgi:hypothetical protein